jgi:hypothetical protein
MCVGGWGVGGVKGWGGGGGVRAFAVLHTHCTHARAWHIPAALLGGSTGGSQGLDSTSALLHADGVRVPPETLLFLLLVLQHREMRRRREARG